MVGGTNKKGGKVFGKWIERDRNLAGLAAWFSKKALAQTPEQRPQQATLLQKLGKRCFMWTLTPGRD
jgi:hypothetical protein